MARKTINQLIREAREDAGLTREAAAWKLGVSVSTLYKIEAGETKDVSVKRITAIAKLTGKPLSFFMEAVA
jgi:transcriptional regulator with XRE-family HTH domain